MLFDSIQAKLMARQQIWQKINVILLMELLNFVGWSLVGLDWKQKSNCFIYL